ncbi:tyrosine--tRNA ligase [Candidatus Kaiserbacteria bacterium RIFCSPHIGHO2_01_FULL_46_22]|uniref:Tyrosine--tRNA ligase n=1 Tax=Candidatus Kaiserbacteria bacterium RIFCSPHIGHO2_01_FULL_46_22 TaxID=1798475 RepID=A0A1F6BWY7_9BACT|nr:MAG: tyrosine--tRNA ligase [Candidatus Kaiserbacteria bacterium RIFCSPHIGHO2_01_FULL_46_22]
MDLVNELKERGLVEHNSADLEKIFSEKRTVYIGTDPTADSLHVGHLSWVVLLKRLADAGHKVILLVGGGTGLIGDPKEKGERPLLTEDVVDANASALERQLNGLVGQRAELEMVNNAEWLREVKLLDFLRDTGKHFTVNELIKRDLIRRRLDNPDDSISYTEFTYSLLQAYDYRELNQRYGCDLQIGGSDQWTNILSGVDLIRKTEGKEVFALSTPLITDASGRKFGKSEGNAVWLDAVKTTPYQFHQFWLNVEDEKVIDYLKIYTLLSLEEIGAIKTGFEADKSGRLAQKRLADEVTRFVHGEEVILETPVHQASSEDTIVDILVATGLATSKREAREFIESGAVTLDGDRVEDINALAKNGTLQRGKRKMNSVEVRV